MYSSNKIFIKTLNAISRHGVTSASASIPSKYQTIVIDNSEKKGFSSKAKRFPGGFENDAPGPGSYVGHTIKSSYDANSYSKKGTGGFASKDKRTFLKNQSYGPGAGTYDVATKINARNDFNKASTTSVFHTPIAQKLDKIEKKPSPNQYSISTAASKLAKSNNVTANAAFKSQSKRDFINLKNAAGMPSPWQYQVNDSLLHHTVKVPMSSFKSTSNRKMMDTPEPNPGPGSYKPNESVQYPKRLTLPRKHYLCISAPAMPLPAPAPGPGPGSYELVNYEGVPKHFMSSSAFVSTTSRWTGDVELSEEMPGPSHYRPRENGKQSFLYNAANRWI